MFLRKAACSLIGAALAVWALAGAANALEAVEVHPIGNLDVISFLDSSAPARTDLIPEIKEIPQFAQLLLSTNELGVNKCYYFKRAGHSVLIDSGWGQEQERKGRLLDLLAREKIAPASITDVLLTHMDWDHIGGLVQGGKAVFPAATLWIAKPEFDAWINRTIQNRPGFALDMAAKVAAVYKDRIKLFNFGEEILPGVEAIDASGHTPGHAAFEITADGGKLIVAGDFVHMHRVQLPRPDLSSIYDVDKQKAAEARQRILQRAVDEGAQLAGMHLPMLSPVRKTEDGGFVMREPR